MAQSKEETTELNVASKAAGRVGMKEFVELLNSPGRLTWLNFSTGFIRGFAGAIGAAVALVALGVAVTYLGGVPLLGKFISNVAAAAGQVPVP